MTGGGGRKARALEVREMLFQWFVDVRTSYKARLPQALLPKKFYAAWLHQHSHTPEEEQLKFSNQWIKDLELEYGVFLRHSNKRYSISKEDVA